MQSAPTPRAPSYNKERRLGTRPLQRLAKSVKIMCFARDNPSWKFNTMNLRVSITNSHCRNQLLAEKQLQLFALFSLCLVLQHGTIRLHIYNTPLCCVCCATLWKFAFSESSRRRLFQGQVRGTRCFYQLEPCCIYCKREVSVCCNRFGHHEEPLAKSEFYLREVLHPRESSLSGISSHRWSA